MRIVFNNLHCNNLIAKPLSFFFVNRPCSYKHTYLLKYLLDNKIEIVVYLDKKSSSFQYRIVRFLFPQKLEFYIWAIFNKLNPFKFKLIKNAIETKKSDILFSYIFEEFNNDLNNSFNGLKVCHLSHYMHGTKELAKSLKNKNIDILVSENNLSKNSLYFNKYFDWFEGDFYVLPHVAQQRFKNIANFDKRQNKAVATGTTFKFINDDFNNFFNTYYYHPMRQEIYEHKDELKNIIDCFIEDYYENNKLKNVNAKDSKFMKLYKKIYNSLFLGKQSNYRKVNFPDLYNKYKIAIVGEEVNNLPGIGFVESMSCGCVYIGLDDPMYTDLGMIPNYHYITYNGTLDDLNEKLNYYLSNKNELELIHKRGFSFAINNFGEDKVSQKFLNFLDNKSKKFVIELNKDKV